jgi:hypothetical protein
MQGCATIPIRSAPRRPEAAPRIDRDQAERQLSELAGTDIRLPERAVVSGGPTTCPACGSNQVTWAVVAAEGKKVIRPGIDGGSDSWRGWSHVSTEEVPPRAS